MNLIELALTTYTESNAEQADTAADMAKQARDEFLKYARSSAKSNLSQEAADLDWQYVIEGLPDQVEEARALLALGRPEYLRYRADSSTEQVAFELVQPCMVCRNDRVSPVTSMFHLGQLLTEDDTPPSDPGEDQEQEPGPLTSILALEDRAANLSRLARRLLAEHPGAGLTVDVASISSYGRGRATATLHLEADSVASARTVADALGIEVTTSVSATPAPYNYVLEQANARGVVDGMDVELRAYTQLSDDEAAAWRAQQDQAADGGDAG